jgi:hypothetical protein
MKIADRRTRLVLGEFNSIENHAVACFISQKAGYSRVEKNVQVGPPLEFRRQVRRRGAAPFATPDRLLKESYFFYNNSEYFRNTTG